MSQAKVTNPKFNNEVSYIPPKNWHITTGYYVNNPYKTWNSLPNISIKSYNLFAPLTGNGLNNELSANYFGGVNKVQLLNYATIFSGGSIKVEHTEYANIRYATFNIAPMENHNISSFSLTSTQTSYQTTKKEQYVSIGVNLQGSINSTSSYFSNSLVKSIGVKIKSVKVGNSYVSTNISNSSSGTKSISKTGTILVPTDMLVEGNNTVTINGDFTWSSVTSESDSIDKSITVNVKLINDSIPLVSITANSSVKVGGEITK